MYNTISKDSLLDILQRLQYHMNGKYDCQVVLDEHMSMMEGSFAIEQYGNVCSIGIQELMSGSDERIWIGKAMVPIVGMCHEVYGHACQMKEQFCLDTCLSKVLALNYYGCKTSSVYYGMLQTDDGQNFPLSNYWKQPYEIAAQYAGIKAANKLMTSVWGKDNTELAILDYQKYRCAANSQLSGESIDCESVDELLSNINKAFSSAIFEHRNYDAQVGKYLQDDLFLYAHERNNGKYMLDVENCKNGLKQDWMMCTVYWSNKDRNDVPPALKNISMSVSDAFSILSSPIKPKPKNRDMDLMELTSSIDMESEDFSMR